METALVGLAGLLIGMLITEHFRKRSRIEQFSGPIFEKRLSIYEKLMEEFILSCGVIDALYEDEEIPLDEKHNLAFDCGLKLIQFTEDNDFYLSEEVTVHIGMLFVNTGDIFLSENTEESRASAYERFKSGYGETKRLIKSASGISTIDNLITEITKSKPESDYISYFRKAKKEHERKKSL
ncbi:hypothetical protein [Amphritea sp. HPY]|uniref:hypothetical protein n=1 Tax=Amphritea sp. HPY TaxID=3421652 RepID=UPI003D7E7314